MKHTKRAIKGSLVLFIASFILISLIGGYLGVRGNQVTFKTLPTQAYEEVSFPSESRDKTQLYGWYMPTESQKTAVLVHGWGGHRGRTLELAEYLQRNAINVLTFDLRGGTGRNSYGQQESGDLAGAISWLKQVKHITDSDISVIGMSMGGAASTIYAAEHPVGSLILLSPVLDINAAKQLALKNRNFIWPSVYAAGGTFVEWVIYAVRPTNPIDVFHKINSPTLVMHAQNDKIAPVDSVYKLREQTAQRNQNNVTYTILGDVGHIYIDQDKSLGFPYAKEIAEFISSH